MKHLIAVLTLLASPALFANECAVTLEGNDALQFDKKEISIPSSCSEMTLTLKHVGKLPEAQMGHNVVITKTADFQAVAQSGMGAGLENDYVVPGDDRVLTHTEIIGGGEETSITVDVSGWDKAGEYTFFCSFPGHFAVMNGTFAFKD